MGQAKLLKVELSLTLLIIVLSGCASRNYVGTYEQKSNTTFTLNSNKSDFIVEVLLDKNGQNAYRLEPIDDRGKTKSFRLEKLKFQGNLIRISGTDYVAQTVKVKIIPREEALKTDLVYGIFTYFIPLFIDPFRSDFYKIAQKSKNINVDLQYNQRYMDDAFQKISTSSKISVFRTYISDYPNSLKVQNANDKIDSLELVSVILMDSEQSLREYITAHSESKFKTTAENMLVSMENARKDYASLNKNTDLDQFIIYLGKHPNFKQSKLAIFDAFKFAISKREIDILLRFLSDIYSKHSGLLSPEEINEITQNCNKTLNELIIVKYSNSRELYQSYVNIWSKALEISSAHEYIGYLDIFNTYRQKISELFLTEYSKALNEKDQVEINKRYLNDFSSYCDDIELFVVCALDYNSSFKGKLTLKNQNFLTVYNDNSSEFSPLKQFYGMSIGDKEELILEKSSILSYKTWLGNKPIVYYERSTNGDRKFSTFNDGKLVEELHYSSISKSYYTYVFLNGQNVTLNELDNNIGKAKKLIATNDVRTAKAFLLNDCKNDLPSNLAQNVKISQLIAECDVKILELERKEAEERRLALELQKEKDRKEFLAFADNLDLYTWKATINNYSFYMNFIKTGSYGGAMISWSSYNTCMSSYTYTIGSNNLIYVESQKNTCGVSPTEVEYVSQGFGPTNLRIRFLGQTWDFYAINRTKP